MNLDNPRVQQPPHAPWTMSRLQFERAIAIGASIDLSSTLTYNSALQSYLTFCHMHQFPIDPTPDMLSFYIVYMSHHIKPSSVNSYLSGICSQLEPFYPTICHVHSSNLVRRTLTGCLKLYSSPTKRKRPLHHDKLIRLAPTFATTLVFNDLLWWSILLTGFYGLLRLGELVIPDQTHLRDDRKLVRRLSVRLEPTAYSFLLPSHKADWFFEGNKLGIDLSVIQSIGRWSSDAFRIYIRTHPVILAGILHSNTLRTPQV
ncbi:hypothetical protein FISHEDRAFT_45737 [Fistulina hepatica ATCC 64428]|uniref:Core-binding (CB) domain-containing protein n=1 Tax=Fistulina hepatica ATCC 64428 TaxID=1128425 RepID=A0A0D7A9Y8_9AGAR|nr:hypothetical protein FISHEDRAFT_45737 [Fistulina hepatica ATCC 64428]